MDASTKESKTMQHCLIVKVSIDFDNNLSTSEIMHKHGITEHAVDSLRIAYNAYRAETKEKIEARKVVRRKWKFVNTKKSKFKGNYVKTPSPFDAIKSNTKGFKPGELAVEMADKTKASGKSDITMSNAMKEAFAKAGL